MSVRVEPGVKLSGHLISEEIGQGACSRVFRAAPEGGGADVAIKVAVRTDLARALKAEGAVLRRLQGPRFVRILEEHLDVDPPFFVLELCEGGDVRARLNAAPGRRLPVEAARAIAQGVLEGMAFAHEEGVVHGDLKPENVLLTAPTSADHGGIGAPKIADLGLSRAAKRDLLEQSRLENSRIGDSLPTEDGKVRGTFDYLAPEVRAGGEITPASDVFALGVLVYELLVGERPLGLFKLPGEALAKSGVDVPPVLDALVARALAHDPEDRFPDAGGMLAYLLHGDAAAEVARDRRSATRARLNPLLTGVLEEQSHDATLIAIYVVAFWSIVPVATSLAMGHTQIATVLASLGGGLATAILVAAAIQRFVARRLLRARLTRSLEEPSA